MTELCAAEDQLAAIMSGALDHAVTRLTLTDFRCYRSLRLEIDAVPVVLTGANGAGKTNLLEALSFLAPGRGLRRARLAEVGRIGAMGPWGVSATVCTQGREYEVGTAIDAPAGEAQLSSSPEAEEAEGSGDGGNQRRGVKIGGEIESQSALAKVLSISWLVPQMDRLFIEGTSGRRVFFDRLAYGFDPDHSKRIGAYERVLRQRSRLLREGVRDAGWLAVLEETMAEHAVAIGATRCDTLARLESGLAISRGEFPGVRLELDGWVEKCLEAEPALAVEGELRERWAASRDIDAATGRTSIGVHRTDLLARHGDTDTPAAQCSTGEQKALLLAIVLAQGRVLAARQGHPPILLLDEVIAHLDEARRQALFQELLAMRAQAWLSGTDSTSFAALRGHAHFMSVAESCVSSA